MSRSSEYCWRVWVIRVPLSEYCWRVWVIRVPLSESSSQEDSFDLQGTLTSLLNCLSNITKTNELYESITFQQHFKVSSLPNSSEHEDDDVSEKVRSLSETLHPNNIEIDYTTGKIVKNQAEAMSNFIYTLVAGMFNQNFLVCKVSDQLSSYSPC